MDPRLTRGRPAERPQQQTRPEQASAQPAAATSARSFRPLESKGRSKLPFIIGGVAALLILLALAWMFLGLGHPGPRGDRYQMVYLDDGKVFFGKLKNTHGDYLRLEHAYSVRSSDLPSDATADQKQAVSNNVSLVKVGDLVYGPENVMMIRAEKVNFWQDLQENSKVAKAIGDAAK